jgi:hypothetical protein
MKPVPTLPAVPDEATARGASIRPRHRHGDGLARVQRAVTATATVAAVALLAAACGGSPSSTSSGGSPNAGRSANSRIGISYAHCMRSHGVPQYPDPNGSNELANGLPKVGLQQLDVSSSQYRAAQNACAHLLPNGGQMSAAQTQQDLDAMRRFAQCMRSHGVPTWPDPSYDPTAGWGFNLVHVQGFNPNSAQIDNKMNGCDRGLPPGIGVPLSRPGRPG